MTTRHEVFTSDVVIRLPSTKELKTQLDKIENSIKTSVASMQRSLTLSTTGVSDLSGKQGGLSKTTVKQARQIQEAVSKEMRSIRQEFALTAKAGERFNPLSGMKDAMSRVAGQLGSTSDQVFKRLQRLSGEGGNAFRELRVVSVAEAQKMSDILWGHSIFPDMAKGIVESFRLMSSKSIEYFVSFAKTIKDVSLKISAHVKQGFGALQNKIAEIATPQVWQSIRYGIRGLDNALTAVNTTLALFTAGLNFLVPIGQVSLAMNVATKAAAALAARFEEVTRVKRTFDASAKAGVSFGSKVISDKDLAVVNAARLALSNLANEYNKVKTSSFGASKYLAETKGLTKEVVLSLKKLSESTDLAGVAAGAERVRRQMDNLASSMGKLKALSKIEGIQAIIPIVDNARLTSTVKATENTLVEFKKRISASMGATAEATEDMAKKSAGSMLKLRSGLDKLNPFSPIAENAQDVSDKVVGNSIIPDMIYEIESEFKTLPDKTAPHVLKMRDLFKQLRKDAQSEIRVDGVVSDATLTRLKALQVDVKKVKGDSIRELSEQMERLGEVTQKTSVNTVKRLQNVTFGLQVMSGKGGNAIVGLRTALFGIGASTDPVAITLDKLGTKTNDLAFAFKSFASGPADRLKFSMGQVAKEMSVQTTAIDSQVKALKHLHQSEGGRATDLSNLELQMRKVRKSYKDIEVTAISGGKIQQQVIRAQVEGVSELENEYDSLIRRGVIKLGTESDKAFKEMISGAKGGVAATNLMYSQQQKLNVALEKAKRRGEENMNVFAVMLKRISAPFRLALKFTKSFASSLAKAINPAKRLTKSLSSIRTIALGVFGGNILTSAINRIGQSLGRLPAKLINLGSTAEESMSKFNAVFKEVSDSTRESVTALADELGRSRYELATYAASFQDTFVPLGFARDEAAKMSTALTRLTVDMSSFNNVTQDKASADLQAALTGSHAVMKKYGVILNDATLSQELLRLGMADSMATATEQQKVLARTSLIIQGTTDAQGDAIRTSESWANQNRILGATLKDTGTDIGLSLQQAFAPFLMVLNQIANILAPRAIAAFEGLKKSVTPFLEILSDAFASGNFDQVFDAMADSIGNGVSAIIDYLNEFIPAAFNWGFSFVSQIAEGIYDAAGSVIAEAVSYVGEIISSFLEPGSPPEKGALSSIDEWGKDLVDVFAASFESADFDFVEKSLSPIEDYIANKFGKSGFGLFETIRDQFVTLTEEINRTGRVNEGMFDDIVKSLGEGNEEMKRLLKLQVESKRATKALADIQKEVTAAEKAGFVPKALRDKLRSAEAQVEEAKKNVTWQEKYIKFQGKTSANFGKMAKAAASVGKTAAAGTKKAVDALARYRKFVTQGYAEEKRILEEQFDAGEISREEYVKASIKLEEKYLDASRRTGMLAGLTEHSDRLKDLKLDLEGLKEGKGISSGLLPISEILGGLDSDGAISAAGSAISENLMAGFTESLSKKFDELKPILSKKISEIWEQIRSDFKSQNIDPLVESLQLPFEKISGFFTELKKNAKAFATGFGLIGAAIFALGAKFPAVSKALGPFGKILRSLGSWMLKIGSKVAPLIVKFTTKVLPGLIKGIVKIGPKIAKLSGWVGLAIAAITALIYGIKSNKDQLVAIFDDFVTRAKDMVSRMGKALAPIFSIIAAIFGIGEEGSVPESVSSAIEFIKDIVDSVMPAIQKTFEGVFNIIYGVIQGVLLPAIDLFIGGLALLTGQNELASESLLKAWDGIKTGAKRAFDGILDIVEGIDVAIINVLGTVIESLLDSIGLGDAADSFADFRYQIIEVLRGTFGDISDTIGSLISGDIDLSEAAGKILESFKSYYAFLFDGISSALEFVSDKIIELWPVAIDSITNFFTQTIPQWAKNLGDLLGEWFSTAIDYVSENWQGWADSIGNVIGKIVSGVLSFMTETIPKWIVDLYGKFREWFTGAFSKSDEDGDSFGTRLGELIGKIIGSTLTFMTETLPAWIASISEKFSSLMSGLVSYVSENWPTWKEQISELLSSMISGMITILFVKIPEWELQFVEFIKTLVSSIATWLTEEGPTVGQNIFDGFILAMNSFFTLLTDGIPAMIEALKGILGEVIRGAASGVAETGPEWLKSMLGVGEEAVVKVAEGAASATDDFDSATAGMGEAISAPIEQGTADAEAALQALADNAVNNSIIPDMVNSIGLEFANMSMSIMATLTTFSVSAMGTFTSIEASWKTSVTNMTNEFNKFSIKAKKILDDLIQRFNDLTESIEDTVEAIILLSETIELLQEADFGDMIEAFDRMKNIMGRVSDHTEDVYTWLRKAVKEAQRLHNALTGEGAPLADDYKVDGAHALGAWSIPKDGYRAILHKKELVMPAAMADSFRSMIDLLSRAGIGSQSLSFTPPSATGASGNQNTFLGANFYFPNVTGAKDAEGFVGALDGLIARSRAYSAIG